MCGRYVLKRKDLEALMTQLGVKDPRDFVSRYNISPGTAVPAIRRVASNRDRELTALEWGLVPRWSKDAKSGARMANARAEGIAAKPAFRDALRRRRCIVPASGFYEWQTIGKLKQPWFFQRADESPIALAGIWECWRSADGVDLETCSLITTTPNDVVRPLHDRMPVILSGAAVDTWLDPDVAEPAQVESLLVPLPDGALKRTSVSPLVNSVRHEGPDCIAAAEPITEEPPPPQLSFDLG